MKLSEITAEELAATCYEQARMALGQTVARMFEQRNLLPLNEDQEAIILAVMARSHALTIYSLHAQGKSAKVALALFEGGNCDAWNAAVEAVYGPCEDRIDPSK